MPAGPSFGTGRGWPSGWLGAQLLRELAGRRESCYRFQNMFPSVQDFQSQGMRLSVMGPTYQALNVSLCQALGVTFLAKFSCAT